MRITEEQLYKMICESINDVLMEEDDYPDVVGNFDENGAKSWGRRVWDKIRGFRYGVTKNGQNLSPAKMAMRSAPMGAAAAAVMPTNGNGLAGNAAHWVAYNTLSSNLGYVAGLATHGIMGIALVRHIRICVQSYYDFINKHVPGKIFPSVAKNVINMAGVERVKAQKTCVSAQMAMKNAIHAYNLTFPKTPTSEKEIYALAKQSGELPTNSNGGYNNLGQKEFDTNFSQRYVGESFNKKKKIITENQSVGELKKQFSGMDEKTAKDVLIQAMCEYVKIRDVWEGWTTYINSIATKFKENGLTLQNSVDGGKLGNGLVSRWVNNVAGKFGFNIPNTGIISRATSRQMGPTEGIIINLRTINPVYKVTTNQTTKTKIDCILLQQEKTNHYFAIPNPKPGITAQRGQGYTLNYSRNLITQTVNDTDYGTIYVLGGTNSTELTNIND